MTNPFDECSGEYARYRPGYPAEFFDYLTSACRLDERAPVLDVGAGTGKASAPLADRGIPVISVEPSLAMARQGVQFYSNLRYTAATADTLPFSAGMFSLVIAAQSFHWFSPETTLPEFARVLTKRGHFAVFWNSRDRTKECVRDFEDLIRLFNPQHKVSYRMKDWSAVIASGGLFRILDQRQFSQTVPMTMPDWIGLSRSVSYIRSIGGDKMPKFERALEKRLSIYSSLDCPYVTDVWLAETNYD